MSTPDAVLLICRDAELRDAAFEAFLARGVRVDAVGDEESGKTRLAKDTYVAVVVDDPDFPVDSYPDVSFHPVTAPLAMDALEALAERVIPAAPPAE